jgi:hypothetical protein
MGDKPRITPTPNAIEEWTDIPKVCNYFMVYGFFTSV